MQPPEGKAVSCIRRSRLSFPTSKAEDEAAEPERGDRTESAPESLDRRGIPPGRGIVMKAEEQQALDGGCNTIACSVEQAFAQLVRREIDAEEIARDAASRRDNDDAGRVQVLMLRAIVAVAQAHGLCELADGAGVCGEEMPSDARSR